MLGRWLLLLPLMAVACSTATPRATSDAAKPPAAAGTRPDTEELKRRAENGDHAAEWQLGSMYDSGAGVPRDGRQAVAWYRRAAEGGYADAQNSLGSIYQAERNYPAAREWYQKAADQGHAIALNNLAYLYDLGLGVAQDRKRAFGLYSKAADEGEPEAMLNIAVMYGAGQLGDKDLIQAYVWTLRARRYRANCFAKDAKLDERVGGAIRYAEQHLGAEQIEQARRVALSWSPKNSCPSALP